MVSANQFIRYHNTPVGVGPPKNLKILFTQNDNTVNICWNSSFHTIPVKYGVIVADTISSTVVIMANTTDLYYGPKLNYCYKYSITVTAYSDDFDPASSNVIAQYSQLFSELVNSL